MEVLSTGSGGSWSVKAAPGLPEGSYTAFATQLGTDGVTSDFSSLAGFTVDATAPTVSLTSAPSGTSNDNTPSFGGTLGTATGDLPNVILRLYTGTGTSGSPVQTITATVSGTSWSAAGATLPDGTYTARAEQADAVGNVGYSAKLTFTIDTTPRAAPGPTPPNAPSPSPSGSPSGTSPAPSPATAPAPSPGPSTAGVKLTLQSAQTQHLRRKGAVSLVVLATCSSTCKLALTGRVTTTSRSRRGHRADTRTLLVRRITVSRVLAGKRIKVKIALSARSRKALLKALAKKRQLTLTLSGIATVPGLQSGAAQVTIRLVV